MEHAAAIGSRVLVIGLAGAGKSTFSRVLAARTGLPLIHLDVHRWKPGWIEPTDDEWREKQRELFSGKRWIADGNDRESLDLRIQRADTVIVLETPWWICVGRAFVRGLREPVGEMPEGCDYSALRTLRDEWQLVGRIFRHRHSEPAHANALISRNGSHVVVHRLWSKHDAQMFLDALDAPAPSR